MIIKYQIEYWNEVKRKYIKLWKGTSFEMAEKMINKPYMHSTRRLIKTTEEILYTIKKRND